MDQDVTPFDKAYALLLHLRKLSESETDLSTESPQPEVSNQNLSPQERVAARMKHIAGLRDSKRISEKSIIDSLVNSVPSRKSMHDIFMSASQDSSEWPREPLKVRGEPSKTVIESPATGHAKNIAEQSTSSGTSKFANEFQAALDSRIEELECEYEAKVALTVKLAREQALQEGRQGVANEAAQLIADLTSKINRLEAEIVQKNLLLKSSMAKAAILDSKMSMFREKSAKSQEQGSNSDPKEALNIELDYYNKLAFRTVEDDLTLSGSLKSSSHRPHAQNNEENESELARLRKLVTLAEKRLAASLGKNTDLEVSLKNNQSRVSSLLKLHEAQSSFLLSFFDFAAEPPGISSAEPFRCGILKAFRQQNNVRNYSALSWRALELLDDWLCSGKPEPLRALLDLVGTPSPTLRSRISSLFQIAVSIREHQTGVPKSSANFEAKGDALDNNDTCVLQILSEAESVLLQCKEHVRSGTEPSPLTHKAVAPTHEQRKKRWLMIKSATMLQEAAAAIPTAINGPTGKITLVFTDIQSSTLLWQLHSERMSEALRSHNQILREAIREFSGYEVKTIGDAFMIAFADPQLAVNFCMLIQDRLMKHTWDSVFNEAVEPTMTRILEDVGLAPPQSLWNGLRVRVGVHYGEPLSEFDPVTRRTDYFGPMVNLSARIQGVALGGQTLVSSQVLESIRIEKIPVTCEVAPGGTHRLKGFESPVQLFSIIPSALAKRSADFEEQIRKRSAKPPHTDGTLLDSTSLRAEKFTKTESPVTFVVVILQRLPELTESQWESSLSQVMALIKNVAHLSDGIISKEAASVVQLVFDTTVNALRFSSQLQLSSRNLDYDAELKALTDFTSLSPAGQATLLYRGIAPKIGVHHFTAQGQIDVFSNTVVFHHSEAHAIVATLALSARQGEILVSSAVVPFVDTNALRMVELPDPAVIPDANPVNAFLLVPAELEERLRMRPEFSPEGIAGGEVFRRGDCESCGRGLGPLCLKCVRVECKNCSKEFAVPRQCLDCSAATRLSRGSNTLTSHNQSNGLLTPGAISLEQSQSIGSPPAGRRDSGAKQNRSLHRKSSSNSVHSLAEGSITRSRLQNALRPRQGMCSNSSAVSFTSALAPSASENNLSIEGTPDGRDL